tara:strand:- start:775 stop:978 length:204 start_codon:yes stop_codon:yes gene_type:complete
LNLAKNNKIKIFYGDLEISSILVRKHQFKNQKFVNVNYNRRTKKDGNNLGFSDSFFIMKRIILKNLF